MRTFLEFAERNSLLEFCKQRRKGAEVIAKKAEEKGGVAQLTSWHFFAKLPAYDKIIEKLEKQQSIDFIKEEFNKIKEKISENLTQKQFQELTGELEVLGEVWIKS